MADVHIKAEIGPEIQLFRNLHGGVGIQHRVFEHADDQHRAPDLGQSFRHVEIPRAFGHDDEAGKLFFRHRGRGLQQGVPELRKDLRRVKGLAEGQVQAFSVFLTGQSHPFFQYLVVLRQQVGAGGAYDHFLYQLRMVQGQLQPHHAPLRRAEEVYVRQAQLPQGRRRVLRHFRHGVDGWQLLPAVEHVDRVCFGQGRVLGGDGLGRPHDALHAESGQDDQGLFPLSEAEKVHAEISRVHSLDHDSHSVLLIGLMRLL